MTKTTIPPEAIEHELNFWRRFVHTDQFKSWIYGSKTPELDATVAETILGFPEPSMLDVGSGVVSILRGLHLNATIQAVDPLAEHYKTVFDYAAHDIIPPRPIAVENLECLDKVYDIVHMRNAFDHCQDPARGFNELWNRVTKGGCLIIQGFRDEALHEDYAGFHQWNMRLGSLNQLVMQGRERTMEFGTGDITRESQLITGRQWIVWIKHKK